MHLPKNLLRRVSVFGAAFIIGLILMVPSYFAVLWYTSPREDVQPSSWEQFAVAASGVRVPPTYVYEEQGIIQYKYNTQWYSFAKENHNASGYRPVYVNDLRAKMSRAAVVLLAAAGPVFAASVNPQMGSLKSSKVRRSLVAQGPSPVKPAGKLLPQQFCRRPAERPAAAPGEGAGEGTAAKGSPQAIYKVSSDAAFTGPAGYIEPKKNVDFIAQCLQHPELLDQTGAKIPSGIMLYGPPGADSTIRSLFNASSIHAVMCGRRTILPEDIHAARSQDLSRRHVRRAAKSLDREIAAYHEAGHTVILKLLCHESVPKVSIAGTSSKTHGPTIRAGQDTGREPLRIHKLRSRIIAAYGGRAAEEMVFGEAATASKQDVLDASRWIREYLSCSSSGSLLNEKAFAGIPYSEARLNEARDLSLQLYNEAMVFLSKYCAALERVASALMVQETLLEKELDLLLY